MRTASAREMEINMNVAVEESVVKFGLAEIKPTEIPSFQVQVVVRNAMHESIANICAQFCARAAVSRVRWRQGCQVLADEAGMCDTLDR